MKKYLLLILCYISALYATRFRSDYKYHQAADGWFKLHSVPDTWHEARLRCMYEGKVHLEISSDYKYYQAADGWFKLDRVPASWHEACLRYRYEGASLASPLNAPMSEVMTNLMRLMTLQNGTQSCGVFTGIHATFSKGDFYSIEGVPLSKIAAKRVPWPSYSRSINDCLIMLPDGTVKDNSCYEYLPYICYKKQIQHTINACACGTIDPAYHFDERTGSCYKLHRMGRTWSHAFKICSAEGGYLAIINNDIENEVIKELFAKSPQETLLSVVHKDVVMLGFLDWGHKGTWSTIYGQTLEEAGFAKWSPGTPYNAQYRTSIEYNGHCGSVFRNGLLNDIWCDSYYAFICEKNPTSLFEDEDN